jgi:hypothetical protein
MSRRITDGDGAVWEVALSGRRTQYGADELSLEFRRVAGGAPERRYVRFAPRGAKAAEPAFDQTTDATLRRLLGETQPAWTSPDGGYDRSA